ncbi:zf-HC2 domain-containing protein [Pandoraea sp. NPDC087047]|uniref:zf-HC2 domain-containing protein n=1 Tax=Pandoraea sp. NPDC087047 TaxID=3364390 RepID=UPI00381FEE44
MPLANCKTVTRTLSDKLDRALTLRERARVRVHLLGCNGCRAYASQLAALRLLAHSVAGHIETPSSQTDE